MIRLFLLLGLFLVTAPSYAQGVVVVQSALPTSNGGTADFTSSGFGTPACVMFFTNYGTANGTEVDHATYALGYSDFTNEISLSHTDEDNVTTTDTGSAIQQDALHTQESAGQTVDSSCTASTITDGVRLTCADAPPAAYLATAVMFNSDIAANCAVGTLATSTTIGGTASVSGLGWQPDVILTFTRNSATIPFDSSGIARAGFGFAVNSGGITQYATGQNSQNNSASADLQQVLRNDRISLNPLSTGGSSFDVTSFDSGGFTVTTRDATATNAIAYLTMELASGIDAKIIACDSPTSTGAKSCTGTGWTPQAGIFYQTMADTLSVYSSSGATNETLGLSAFTASSASTISMWADDAAATTNTTSMVDNKVVRMRNGAADFLTATLTGFQVRTGWT